MVKREKLKVQKKNYVISLVFFGNTYFLSQTHSEKTAVVASDLNSFLIKLLRYQKLICKFRNLNSFFYLTHYKGWLVFHANLFNPYR